MSEVPARAYSPAEELANTLTHAVGAALSVVALVLMLGVAAGTGDAVRVVAAAVFGAALIALYTSSTGYHLATSARRKRTLRVFDHAAIYTLIAGTYTPITLVAMRGGAGWALFGVTWGLALMGVVVTIRFPGRFKPLRVGTYIAMGWMAVFVAGPLIEALPDAGLMWLGAGGLFYTLGTAVYLWKGLLFNHAIWHAFVLGGSACHVICVWLYVLPSAPPVL